MQTENLTETLQNLNQNSHLSWISLIGLWTARPRVLSTLSPQNADNADSRVHTADSADWVLFYFRFWIYIWIAYFLGSGHKLVFS